MRALRAAAGVAALALVLGGGTAWWVDQVEEPGQPTSVKAATGQGPKTAETKPSKPAGWVPTDAEKAKASSLADRLSLEDLAGQLIVARHFADDSSLALVRDKHFAGVMVTNPEILEVQTDDPLSQVKEFNAQINEAGEQRGVPVMVPVDQEGGLVARLGAPMTPFPTFMSAGAAIAGDPQQGAAAVTAATMASGAELRAAGYNTVFAPDGDITVGPSDPIIGSRSAGTDPRTVSRAVVAAVKGYSDAGLISAVKHFPGHNVAADSHRDLPVLGSDKARLRDHDLRPFEAAIANAAPGIMTGHLEVPLIDKGVPASLSRKVVTTGLRENLGFDGIVISDSLGMGAVMSRYPGGNPAVEAIRAGSDIALMPADNLEAWIAVLKALRSGYIPEQQARDSAARVIAYLLHAEASPRMPGEPGSHVAESQALSAAALTVVSRPCPTVPVTSVRPTGSAAAVASFTEAAKEAGLPLGSGPSLTFLGQGSAGAYGDIVVATDAPYGLAQSQAQTRIALYGNDIPAMRALVDVLTGQAEARGRSPVDGIKASTC